ncbi:MAG: cell division protease FtsH [Candidatus Berkelbacteria bacterium Gr01-1014_85]|uniref:ATP-dependent zinc metalloprotease FtsH n=1 Tax=Candidatus Berkelbacteria bacterium Gr01-1014_85 TaxID=2017150 RepID=A0A554JBQ4_9BACT|nr:MAG: cell division protease FtsH [Candidatus Berkelbacteria bacterium Gr01-1014_85]
MLGNSRQRLFGSIILTLIALVIFYTLAGQAQSKPKQVELSVLTQAIKANEVEKLIVDGNTLEAVKKNGDKLKTFKENAANLTDYGISPDTLPIEIKNPNRFDGWSSVLSTVVPLVFFGGFLWFMIRGAQGANNRAMSFGKSGAKQYIPGKNRTTFADVAGLYEAKQELAEIVEFLKNGEKFKLLGAEIPRGVLLIGPAGVGKTLLARAVAGEAEVPFFSISASEFVEMFVGVGASRVRELFATVKKQAPAVLFIDELDAVGRQRGSGMGGSHDEREQTLNQILVEMDGFETNQGVIVLAATNRPDVLDPALLRPGRFDRKVYLDNPDRAERLAILKIHAQNKPVEDSVDLDKVAAGTIGMSGAELRNVMNEAAILAARDNRKTINGHYLNLAIEKVMIGPERRNRLMSDKEKRLTAVHEAGHALLGHILPNTERIHKVTIVSRGRAGGYTWSLPEEERHYYSRQAFTDELISLLGGRTAEQVVFGEITTGAESDLNRATRIALNMVKEYGMSEKVGPITLSAEVGEDYLGRRMRQGREISEKLAETVDSEVKTIVEIASREAERLLKQHRSVLEAISAKLLEVETLDGPEFEALVNPLLGIESVAEVKTEAALAGQTPSVIAPTVPPVTPPVTPAAV